eukprot:7857345-Pyramimonas_sp.AAC.1
MGRADACGLLPEAFGGAPSEATKRARGVPEWAVRAHVDPAKPALQVYYTCPLRWGKVGAKWAPPTYLLSGAKPLRALAAR